MRVLCVLALIFVVIAATSAGRPERNDPVVIETNKKLGRLILKGDDFSILKSAFRSAGVRVKDQFNAKRRQATIVLPNNKRFQALLDRFPVASESGTQLLLAEHTLVSVVDDSSPPGRLVDFTSLLNRRKNSKTVSTSIFSLFFEQPFDIEVGTSKFGMFINGNRVEKIYKAKNGIIYIIDGDLHRETYPFVFTRGGNPTIADALDFLNQDYFYPLSSIFASYVEQTQSETGADVQIFFELTKRAKRFLVLLPSNPYILRRNVKDARKRGVANLNTKIVMEHTFDIGEPVSRGTLFDAVIGQGRSFELTNLNGRTSIFDVETLPYGKQVLTVDGMQAEPDFFEVLAANGLLLPIRGMLWYNYGPGKK